MTPKKEIEKLRGELERHNRLYYLDAAPEISDYDFDQLLRKLEALEEKHPEFADPNSPTARVGGQLIGEFAPVIHDPPMLSIEPVSATLSVAGLSTAGVCLVSLIRAEYV